MSAPHDTITPLGAGPGGGSSALPEGTLILDDRFRLLKLLGEGGMGLVYLAEQVSLGRKVAVKVLREDLSLQPGMAERFRREGKLLSSVEHPSLVRVIDFGLHGASACLVMEYVEGETLESLLRQGPLSPSRAVPILLQLCQGLAAIHDKGIVHRDLKPENVVLTHLHGGEQARLLDFGIARLATPEAEASVTQVGMVLGTPEVLSPEQALGQPLDARSDIYSLGVVAYRMLSGQLPLPGPSPSQFVAQHISQTPTPLLQAAPHLSGCEALTDVVMACLRKAPDERPSSALALATELQRAAAAATPGAAPAQAAPLQLTVTASGLGAPAGPTPSLGPADPQWAHLGVAAVRAGLDSQVSLSHPRRRRWLRRLLAGAMLLTLAVCAAAFARYWHEPARKMRRLVAAGRGSEALQVIDDAKEAGKSWRLQMLKAAALHQVNRHDDELEVMKSVPADEALEPLAIEALSDDFGHKETAPVRKVVASYAKPHVLPLLQEVAEAPLSKGQFGALRLIDLEYAGQGLPLVELYAQGLQSTDCRVRQVAAKRLGELRNAEALEPLKQLKELPRKGTTPEGDCGQAAAALALKQLEKELQP